MMQESYRFRHAGPYERTLLAVRAYNTGLFGRKIRKDLPMDFIAQEIDRPLPEAIMAAEWLEEKGYLRLYPLPEDSSKLLVSAYSLDGQRLI
jgi:hypothetical protein